MLKMTTIDPARTRKFLFCAVLALIPATQHADAGVAPTFMPAPAVESFTAMRMESAKHPCYLGAPTNSTERVAVLKAYSDRAMPQFLALSEAWLRKCPTDGQVYLARASALSDAGDTLAAGQHRFMFYGLLMSITSSGDGRSKGSAYKVISVDEEYTVLDYFGAKLKHHELVEHYDVMTVEIGGKQAAIWFDIAIPLTKR